MFNVGGDKDLQDVLKGYFVAVVGLALGVGAVWLFNAVGPG